ncbi:PREDICTED: intraflagellar transport protein 172 homolog isoform X2 [Amphimedon queenslandica]|uniref:Intraflagellar transport protein 172 homolog n=1 Tax=Amphimedon queenslandica TaxID=400682 RepID=A0AAN0JD33_AMPQE|nr:PREDICTED: intraflagellar transport protein 172 homolog isoform X2 [Amphimedon queenslandica]|eukprot:XP_019854623.1 PREDICTED: intraflagellar transport protein 172 homolog isoform X2 [Amphimedon queenslandica]
MSAVTTLIWPIQQPTFIFGLADGKVKLGNVKGSKSQTIYSSESYVVSLTSSPSGQGILCGHADGTIVRYTFDNDSELSKGPVCKHSCSPYALSWSLTSIVAAGCDRRVMVYNHSGKPIQQFDYSKEEDEKEFMCSATSPSGQTVVLGSFNRLRVYNWSPRKEMWDEATPKFIDNLYTITALTWKRDGSRLTSGSLCGAVDLFDCCLRRVTYRNKFELTYVGPSQVIVKNIGTGARVILKSQFDYEIEKVDVMGKDRYLVAYTSSTILLGDMANCKLSEIMWSDTGGNEKFYFENQSVCMIFNAGELTLVEYGINDILGSVRTEVMNPHLISVRINERKQKDIEQCKMLAYLMDLQTISIMDLSSGVTVGSVSHDTRINWLELNETGRKLLFRDKKLKLNLYDVESETLSPLLSYCSFVQWVPQSDVVVAQNRDSLCIWYNIDSPDKVTMFPMKGEVTGIEKQGGQTQVIVQSGVETMSYGLDEGLIEFGTAIDDGDHLRAIHFLETLELTKEVEAMWNTLAGITLQEGQLKMAERCYAAVRDVSKARYLKDVNQLANKITTETGHDGSKHYLIQAKVAILNKQFKTAERLLLEKGDSENAMEMYMELGRWEDVLAVAELTGHPDLDGLKASHLQWLLDSGQEERAGEMREKEGDLHSAVNLYIKAGLPAKAARLVTQHPELSGQLDLLQQLASSLIRGGLFERAGELLEQARLYQEAMEAYRRGGAFRKAIELARGAFPNEVVSLEEQWGDQLCSQKQYESAILHFIESGNVMKAIEAAIHGRQWSKAVQIVETQDPSATEEYHKQIADHYASIKNYELAESLYVRSGQFKAAVEMYIKSDQWEPAYRIAVDCMGSDEVHGLYLAKAEELETQGRLREAERLYILVKEPDLAISMYNKCKQYEPMMKLVATYHPDILPDTHLHLAKELEADKQYRQAENHYVQGNEWKSAVNMYRTHSLWDDAYRVAKAHGGSNAANQVAYLWAKSLGGDSAVKLLSKFGLLEAAVDYATENYSFDFAFEIAKAALKSKVPEIHLKYAIYLEDEGKFSEAELAFIRAGKPKEAVLMYVHQQDWDAAQHVAEEHSPESVPDVLIGQARVAFQKKDYQKAESYLLRADRPDLVVSQYKDAEMWNDALRIIKEYLPHKLDEFQREMAARSGKNYQDLLSQAKTWESSGEYSRAISTYLLLTVQNCENQDILIQSWNKAVDLCVKFAREKEADVVKLVCDRLANINRYSEAGELFISSDMIKEGIDMFISGEEWEKARHVAKTIAPRFEQYVEEAYIDFLKERNRPEEMQRVDPDGALKMYMQSGEWDKCLQLAKELGPSVLFKYVALYAAHLIKSNASLSALKLFTTYGAPPLPQNFNIYKRLCMEVFGENLEGGTAYPTYSSLRNMLFSIVDELSRTSESGSLSCREFEQYLLVSHYLATRSACSRVPQLNGIVAKISVSLLRHTDVIPADRAFYQAGMYCKAVGLESMAFIFYNRFLDLSEAIEEGSLDMIDNSDFVDTDIPFEVPLPEQPFMTEDKREEIKEWVLALSMDRQVEQTLPLDDERQTYVASLTSPHTGVTSLPCIVTGYPVLKQKVEFKRGGRCANKGDWTKFVMNTKASQNEECLDVVHFITKWCGQPLNPAHTF